jgi:predicted choloylglycine hydrolase
MDGKIELFRLKRKSPFEMGYEQGSQFKAEINQMYSDLTHSEDLLASKPSLLPRFLFIKLVNSISSKKIKEPIQDNLPSQWEFLEGLREGSGIHMKKLLFLQALDALGTQIQNYRKGEGNLDYGECSAVGVSGETSVTGKPLIIKNWDGPESLANYIFFRHVIPLDEKRYSTLSSGVYALAGINNGINEKGLSIVYNYAYPKEIGEKGIPPMFLIREALERCVTVPEVIELFKTNPRLGGANIMVGDQTGDLAVIEMGPNDIKVRHSSDKSHNYLICTNHYLTPEMKLREVPRNAVYTEDATQSQRGEPVHKSSLLRYQAAFSILKSESPNVISLEFLNEKIQQNHGPNNNPSRYTFCNHGPHISTGFGVMLNAEKKTFFAIKGKPCQRTMQKFSF